MSSSGMTGTGLHSGAPAGLVLEPLPPGSGIVFGSIISGETVPALVDWVESTDYATTLSRNGASIRTVEHLLSALHAYGITNLLIKVHGEIPVLDGSAVEFCRTLEEVGLEFNVTRERIRQIEAKAIRKLRHPNRSRKLRGYLE